MSFLCLNYANVLGNEMKLRRKKGKIVFEPNCLISAVPGLTDLRQLGVCTVAGLSEKVREHANLYLIHPICFYLPRF